MEIINEKAFLLFIEPLGSKSVPIIDIYTRKMTGAFRTSQKGTSGYGSSNPIFFPGGGYRGFHVCCPNSGSSSTDHLIKTRENVFVDVNGEHVPAVITNALCVHYVACHRNEVPPSMLDSILLLEAEEVEPTQQELGI